MWHFVGSPTHHNPTPVFDLEAIWESTDEISEGMPPKTGHGLGFMQSKSFRACGCGRRGDLPSCHPKSGFLHSWLHVSQGTSGQPIRMFYPQSVQWRQVGRTGHRTLGAEEETVTGAWALKVPHSKIKKWFNKKNWVTELKCIRILIKSFSFTHLAPPKYRDVRRFYLVERS